MIQTLVSGAIGGALALVLVFAGTASLAPSSSAPQADPESVPYADE